MGVQCSKLRNNRHDASGINRAIQRCGHPKCIQELIIGADVNDMDEFGLTPLMTAVKYRQGACIPILLNTGADVNVRNDSGVTALLIALTEDYYGVINVLLHAGADVNDADGNGVPALMVAAEMANFIASTLY